MSYTYEYGTNFTELKTILTNRPSDDYPYQMDNFFDPDKDNGLDEAQSFTLVAKDENGNVVGTYAARTLDYSIYEEFFENRAAVTGGEYYAPSIPAGQAWYSSCQWIHKDHRGQRLGIQMDRMKKDKIWELGGDVNYANCRDALKEYHVDKLGYNEYQHQATIPGGVGGAGTSADKNYYLVYETRP